MQLGVEDVDREGQEGTGGSRKGEVESRRVRHGWYGDGNG